MLFYMDKMLTSGVSYALAHRNVKVACEVPERAEKCFKVSTAGLKAPLRLTFRHEREKIQPDILVLVS